MCACVCVCACACERKETDDLKKRGRDLARALGCCYWCDSPVPREGNVLTDKTPKEEEKPKKRNGRAESTLTPMKVRGYADTHIVAQPFCQFGLKKSCLYLPSRLKKKGHM